MLNTTLLYLVGYGLLLLVPNNKVYLLVFLAVGGWLFWKQKLSLVLSVFSILLLSLPFERGIRDWVISVVPPGPDWWLLGYQFYFTFSVKSILVILAVLLNRPFRLKVAKEWRWWVWLVVVFGAVAVVSTLKAADWGLALLGLVRLLQPIGLLFVSLRIFKLPDGVRLFRSFSTVSLLCLGLVGIIQMVLKRPIGLFLEETYFTSPEGFATTDGDLLMRVSGLLTHPTYFGSFLSILLPINIGLWLSRIKTKTHYLEKYLVATAVAVGVIALLGTYSRSAWISMALMGGGFGWWALRSLGRSRLINSFLNFKTFLVTGLLAVVVFFLVGQSVITRLSTFANIWESGNGTGRISLIKYAGLMVKTYPIFGVGLNHFTRVMNEYDLTLEEATFLYPVHNTFMLFGAELGVVGGGLFIIIMAGWLYHYWSTAKTGVAAMGLWLAVAAFVVNAQFHTLFSLDPSLDLTMIVMALAVSSRVKAGGGND